MEEGKEAKQKNFENLKHFFITDFRIKQRLIDLYPNEQEMYGQAAREKYVDKLYKEYKKPGNASWKNKSYWSSTFEENGCGLATLAILASGYNKNYTPEDFRRKYINFAGKHLEGDQMSEEINKTFGLKNSDFVYADVYLKKEYVFNHLKEDKPVLICVWNKPDDKWTTTSHYMLLLGTDNINKVYVSNPNGLYGEKKMSGWYNQEEILPYIAKALFINE